MAQLNFQKFSVNISCDSSLEDIFTMKNNKFYFREEIKEKKEGAMPSLPKYLSVFEREDKCLSDTSLYRRWTLKLLETEPEPEFIVCQDDKNKKLIFSYRENDDILMIFSQDAFILLSIIIVHFNGDAGKGESILPSSVILYPPISSILVAFRARSQVPNDYDAYKKTWMNTFTGQWHNNLNYFHYDNGFLTTIYNDKDNMDNYSCFSDYVEHDYKDRFICILDCLNHIKKEYSAFSINF